jgi:uncharacterized protein YbaR (Trm112 family)/SAM-dependent methyltransferase
MRVITKKYSNHSHIGKHMQPNIKISQAMQEALRCPSCRTKLNISEKHINCTNSSCNAHFPVIDGVPVLINEQSSIFSVNDFVSRQDTFFKNEDGKTLKKVIRKLIPTISKNIKGNENYHHLNNLLLKKSGTPRVLVIGGSILGNGMEILINNTSLSLDLVESDVSFGPRTMLICDGHDIPFEDESFDAVVIQAVLEHVADPYRCVEEVHRVLNKQGLVYAETPFMQQVHGGRYDFTRFTHLGHRRLFRKFEEIDSGAVCGPGMALSWSYQYFLTSFFSSKTLRAVARNFANLTSFYLKYIDSYLIDKPGTLDAASGYYFIGEKSEQVLSDRDLIKLYKGAE